MLNRYRVQLHQNIPSIGDEIHDATTPTISQLTNDEEDSSSKKYIRSSSTIQILNYPHTKQALNNYVNPIELENNDVIKCISTATSPQAEALRTPSLLKPEEQTILFSMRSSICSILFFGDLMKLLFYANFLLKKVRTILITDIPSLTTEEQSSTIFQQFQIQTKRLYSSQQMKYWQILCVFCQTFKVQLSLQILLILLCNVMKLTSSLLIRQLIDDIGSSANDTNLFELAVYIAITNVLYLGLMHHSNKINYRLSSQFRIVFMRVLFEKVSTLSVFVVKQANLGKLVTLISNDLNSIEGKFYLMINLMVIPFGLIAVACILFLRFGFLGVVGLLTLAGYIPIQLCLAQLSSKKFKIKSTLVDKRISMMNEIIEGIKVIKMQTWEKAFMESAKKIRKLELKEILYIQSIAIIDHAISLSSGMIASFLVFALVHEYGNSETLTYGNMIATYDLLQYTRQTMVAFTGFGLTGLLELRVVLKRMASVLAISDSVKPSTDQPNDLQKGEICMNNFSGFWQESPCVSNISLSFKPGECTVLTGRMGSGKTSLLHSIAQQIPRFSGGFAFNGTIALVEQDPYIFNTTIRQNILFGKPYNASLYSQTIEACNLTEDILAFELGDDTSIGDQGTNLSGGQRARIALARALYSEADIYLLDDPLSAVDSKVAYSLYEKVVRGIMRKSTVILATHLIHTVSSSDRFLIIEECKIYANGSFNEISTKILQMNYLDENSRFQLSQSQINSNQFESVLSVKTKELESSHQVLIDRCIDAYQERSIQPFHDTTSFNGLGPALSHSPMKKRCALNDQIIPFVNPHPNQREFSRFNFPTTAATIDPRRRSFLASQFNDSNGIASFHPTSVPSKYFQNITQSLMMNDQVESKEQGLSSTEQGKEYSEQVYESPIKTRNPRAFFNNNLLVVSRQPSAFKVMKAINEDELYSSPIKQNLQNQRRGSTEKVNQNFYCSTIQNKKDEMSNFQQESFANIKDEIISNFKGHQNIRFQQEQLVSNQQNAQQIVQTSTPASPSTEAKAERVTDLSSPQLMSVRGSTYTQLIGYCSYYRILIPLIVILFIGSELLSVLFTKGLGVASQELDSIERWTIVQILGWITLGFTLSLILKYFLLLFLISSSCTNIHTEMIGKLLTANMSFFSSKPTSEIISAFSADLGIVDQALLMASMDTIEIVCSYCVLLITTIQINPYFAVVALLQSGFLVAFLRFSKNSLTAAKSADFFYKHPVLNAFSTCVAGVLPIRIYQQTKSFQEQYNRVSDVSLRASLMYWYISRGFGVIVNAFSVISGIIGIFMLLIVESDGIIMGQSIIYFLAISDNVQWGLRQLIATDVVMSSAQRLLDLCTIETEADHISEYDIADLEDDFPSQAKVEFVNVRMKYSIEGKSVLKGLSFTADAGSRIACVGRTGAGKSSILSALFRLQEIESNEDTKSSSMCSKIAIDGHNCRQLGLHTLRSAMTLIPQNAFLFSGTILDNIDPIKEYSISDIQTVLADLELKDKIDGLKDGLLTHISGQTGGDTIFSEGQRQLICLARALLKRSKFLILDEATSCLDMLTDRLIQQKIRDRFEGSTVITIAHRLNTVADYDKILVLDEGRIIEQGHPHILLRDKHGLFTSMVNHTGEKSAKKIRRIARRAYEQKRK